MEPTIRKLLISKYFVYFIVDLFYFH